MRESALTCDRAPGSLSSLARTKASRTRLHHRLVLRALEAMQRGSLHLELPDGERRHFGSRSPEAVDILPLGISSDATIRVHTPSFFARCLLQGDIGFAESFIEGEWDAPDLTCALAWFLLNIEHAPTLSGSGRRRDWRLNPLKCINRLVHLLRPNTRRIARRNISRHYDLSNEFFALFLDRSMMYSAGRYTSRDDTLEEAQFAKNEALCRSLRLRPGDHVLEIGTGWGGWSIHAAARHGCRVTSVTISREQERLARTRIAEAGLSDRIDVRLQDYRDIEGVYDRIVSIEMMEALGHRYLPRFARVIDRSLKPDGLVAFQFITCPDSRYTALRKGVDFIQKHVFPGTLLLSLNRVNNVMSQTGGFVLHGMIDMAHDYALTLRAWRRAFEARIPEVRALGFDDRFVRKWTYYLCYCEAAFAMRNISVVQTVHTRPNNRSIRSIT